MPPRSSQGAAGNCNRGTHLRQIGFQGGGPQELPMSKVVNAPQGTPGKKPPAPPVRPSRRGRHIAVDNWSSEQLDTDFLIWLRRIGASRRQSKAPGFFIQQDVPPSAPNQRRAKGTLMLKSTNPCPVCGAETALAEIEPHPLHIKFEIHGYLCDRCGPVKSLVVLRSPPLQ
jgi:hypothetical protein